MISRLLDSSSLGTCQPLVATEPYMYMYNRANTQNSYVCIYSI